MTDKPPDYTVMSGAEFRRAVGDDPKKWAEAFVQRAAAMSEPLSDGLRDELAQWFRGAMDASVWAQGRLLDLAVERDARISGDDEHDPAR